MLCYLNDSRHDINTETQVRALRAITDHCPTSPAGGTSSQVTQPHTITISIRKARTRLLIRRLLIDLLVVPPGATNTWSDDNLPEKQNLKY
ncbi:hypothetical protein AVEN_38928-1 [Araneus ventricosus]|uniref:Uncharacterized protein n=1 Tax=Araneus ventricosus TaxID=182803 RepID=A0A4Y2VU55_ARAVE|nr:hypothetical protein AVEN_38928-1 [Araneus ventricosus]